VFEGRIFLRGWISLVLASCALVLTYPSAEPRAEQVPRTGTPDLAERGPGDPKEVEAFFDELITGQLRKEHVVGATVAVVKDGQLVFAKGYGYSDLEKREPVIAEKTLFYSFVTLLLMGRDCEA
jgi:CubicO group peptidase (beta-lactamase class C family)